MKPNRSLGLLILFFILSLPLFADESYLIPAGETLPVGVLTMDASKLSDRYNDSFTGMLNADLIESGVFKPLPEGTIHAALDKRGLSLPREGFANRNIGGEVGRLVGADYMIVASVGLDGANYTVNLFLMDSRNDSILTSVSEGPVGPLAIDFEPAIANAVVKLVEEIAEPVLPERFVEGPLPGMMFARIDSGDYIMGSEHGEKNEHPARRVTIDPFELMTTEVTQSMWMTVMEKNPSKFEGESHPVERVTLDEIKKFMVAMNIKDPTHRYRLPTESEWEYAARSGASTQFPFADDAVGLDFFAWFKKNSDGKTHPVGTREPNSFGLYDMLGNVFEYCVDAWYNDYEGAPLSAAARLDRRHPNGPRVIRGGAYVSSAWYCRPASRLDHRPNRREEYVGFRLARTEVE